MDMDLGWFADPLFFGDWPETVKKTIGADLPPLSAEDKRRIKGSLDFLGINYYTGKWVVSDGTALGYNITDVLPAPELPGGKKFIGPLAESFWLRVVPWSFRSLLRYVDARYGGPDMMITENGVSVPKENDLSKTGEFSLLDFRVFWFFWFLDTPFRPLLTTPKTKTKPTNTKQQTTAALVDPFRVDYYKGYLDEMCKAMSEGVKVSTYFAWWVLFSSVLLAFRFLGVLGVAQEATTARISIWSLALWLPGARGSVRPLCRHSGGPAANVAFETPLARARFPPYPPLLRSRPAAAARRKHKTNRNKTRPIAGASWTTSSGRRATSPSLASRTSTSRRPSSRARSKRAASG